MGGWVPFLGMNETGEHQRVPDEKNGRVIAYQIPVALFSVELDRKAPGVTGCVS